MKIEFDDISRFVHGQMPDNERAAFENAIDNDPALRTSVANEITLYRELQNAVRYNTLIAPKKKDFKNLLQEITHEAALQTPKMPKQNMGWWKFAAAAVLLVSVAVYMFYPKPTPNTAKLYEQYFAPDCADATMGAATNDDIEKAKTLVCAKQWAEAKIALSKIASGKIASGKIALGQAQLLLVYVLTETGDYDAALSVLDTLDKGNETNVAWARAGVFLKQNKIAECKQILLKIVETKAAHHKDADELLKTL